MAYSPPGVYTEVEIANNIVQLPGGTRILALIGTGRRTKDVTGESVFQPTTRFNTLINADVSSINSVYDFTGPGGAQKTYLPSGNTTYFGAGYWLSGTNVIAWTVAENAYPLSTTPAIGADYHATFDYSGTTLSGTTLLPISEESVDYLSTASGTATGTVLNITDGVNIISVYDGTDTGSDTPWSGTGTNSDGAGWYQSGSDLVWTNGTLVDYADAVASGIMPASGASYYVEYEYSGTITGQLYTQTGAYSNTLLTGALASGMTTVNSLTSVTGLGGIAGSFPESGTAAATGVDSLGYSKTGSGWTLAGSVADYDITWSPVDSSTYTYPVSAVPAISGVYAVNYSYNKTATDYTPLNFTDYRQIVSEYGDEAEWTLIATGSQAGQYQLDKINPLTLGARIAFANGASVVTLCQMSGVGNTSGDFQNSLNQLQSKTVDVIVPLTVGSGTTSNDMSLTEISLTQQNVKLHCDTMSLPQNKKERVGLGSLGTAEIGDIDTPLTYIFEATSLQDKRASLVAPGLTQVQIQDPAGVFRNVNVDGSFMAVAAGAISCNPLSDVATPLTNKQFSGFTKIIATTTNHPDQEYLESEKNILAAAGNMVIDNNGSRIFIRHQLTTDQTNQANGEFSVVTTTDYVSQAVRFTTESFIGKKLLTVIVLPAIQSTILATMQALAGEAIINAIGAITVTTNPSDPTEVLATVQYVPVFPLNRIRVTFTIRTQI